jgi:hypothetical protein
MEDLFLRGCFSSSTIWPIRGDEMNEWHRSPPIVIGCIDYLAYGTIFTRVMFLPKKKLDVFFPARVGGNRLWKFQKSKIEHRSFYSTLLCRVILIGTVRMYQVLYREYSPLYPSKKASRRRQLEGMRENNIWDDASFLTTDRGRPPRERIFLREGDSFFSIFLFLGSASVAIFGDVNWKLP